MYSIFRRIDLLSLLPCCQVPLNATVPVLFFWLYIKSVSYTHLESYFVDKSIWNVHISYHDDKRFIFFTDQFIAEFSPQEFVDSCEQCLISNHCFSPDEVNEICEHARHCLLYTSMSNGLVVMAIKIECW